jgi:hypothetical protein
VDVTVLKPMYDDLLGRYHALVEEVLAMKREGFVPAPDLSGHAEPVSLPPIIQTAINALMDSGGDELLERMVERQAWALKRQGVDDAEIAAKLTAGEPVDL